MDFDPSQFLSMALSEDQDAVYSARPPYHWNSFGFGFPLGLRPPDLSEPDQEYHPPPGPMVVEGGLQMEQFSVPVFDTLNQEEEPMEDSVQDTINDEEDINMPLQVEITEPDNSAEQKISPAGKNSSPHIKRIIPTTYEESRFRKDFFCGNYERVKLFRLHCTICDRHLGCAPWHTERQMRTHKLFNVAVCRKCFEFFGDVNFPIEDDSEIYCCWCGEGGEVFCCSKCPKIVCKKCIKRNFGEQKVKEIDKNDNWVCFVCDCTDIWPHRALFWGWQRFARETRQNFATLSKEQRQIKLSEDTSHCCWKSKETVPRPTLPRKNIMTKVPLCMIAIVHRLFVLNQPNQQVPQNSFLGSTTKALLTNGVRPILPRPQPTPPYQMIRPNHVFARQSSSSEIYQTPISTGSLRMQRFAPNARSTPYPPMTQIVSFPRGPSPAPRIFQAVNTSYPGRNTIINQTICNEIISVDDDDSPPRPNNAISNKVSHDIAWLEKGVYEIKGALASLNSITSQIIDNINELKYDLTKTTNISERLTTNVKQAIITMAKVNEDISSGRQAAALDNKVSLIMKDIGRTGALAVNPVLKTVPVQVHISKRSEQTQPSIHKKPVPVQNYESSSLNTPRKAPPSVQPETSKPLREEDDPDEIEVNPALLCETVMHIEGNKENNDGNKSTASTPQKDQGTITPQKGQAKTGRPRGSYVKITARKSFPRNNVEVIDLVDDKDNNYHHLCKRFNITPCKVVVKRLENKQLL